MDGKRRGGVFQDVPNPQHMCRIHTGLTSYQITFIVEYFRRERLSIQNHDRKWNLLSIRSLKSVKTWKELYNIFRIFSKLGKED